jgi:hypothetical protein
MKNYDNIQISLYVKGSVGKDGKEYINARASIRQNQEMQKRKYMPDELPKTEKITNSKGEFIANDYSEVDAFWKKQISEINAIAKKNKEEDLFPPF